MVLGVCINCTLPHLHHVNGPRKEFFLWCNGLPLAVPSARPWAIPKPAYGKAKSVILVGPAVSRACVVPPQAPRGRRRGCDASRPGVTPRTRGQVGPAAEDEQGAGAA